MTTPRLDRLVPVAVVLILLGAGCRSGGRGPAVAPAPAPAPSATKDEGVRWSWEAPPPASVGMPAADERGVAFTYGHQHLLLTDGNGGPRWDVARLGLREVAPRLTADLVLAATDDGVAAFRRADGALSWDTALKARANTPVVAAGVAVTSTWEGDLVGLDLATGKVAWKIGLGGSAVGPPAADGAMAVVSWAEEHGRAAGVVAVDAATGRRRWAVPLPAGGTSAPAFTADGAAVVVVAGDLAAHALAAATGEERWRTGLDGAGSPEVPPTPAGAGAVLVAHRLGGLDLLDAATGRRAWQVRTDGAAVRGGPVVGPSGTFALPLDDGRLLLAGPGRPTEFRPAPALISGLAVGPGGVLVAATAGARQNGVVATPDW